MERRAAHGGGDDNAASRLQQVDFESVRGLSGIREATVTVGNLI